VQPPSFFRRSSPVLHCHSPADFATAVPTYLVSTPRLPLYPQISVQDELHFAPCLFRFVRWPFLSPELAFSGFWSSLRRFRAYTSLRCLGFPDSKQLHPTFNSSTILPPPHLRRPIVYTTASFGFKTLSGPPSRLFLWPLILVGVAGNISLLSRRQRNSYLSFLVFGCGFSFFSFLCFCFFFFFFLLLCVFPFLLFFFFFFFIFFGFYSAGVFQAVLENLPSFRAAPTLHLRGEGWLHPLCFLIATYFTPPISCFVKIHSQQATRSLGVILVETAQQLALSN